MILSERRVVTATTAAKRLGVSRQRVWQLCRLGLLVRMHVDGAVYIGTRSLEMLIEAREAMAKNDG